MMNPRVTGKPLNLEAFKRYHSVFQKAMADLESRLTKHRFICGDEKTIADLSAACELSQGKMVALDISGKYPKVN